MVFNGRKVAEREDFYGFVAKPNFIVGYVRIEECDLGFEQEEYPFAMSGWNVAGMYCVYLWDGEWDRVWCNPDDHASLKQMLGDLLTEELEEVECCEDDPEGCIPDAETIAFLDSIIWEEPEDEGLVI